MDTERDQRRRGQVIALGVAVFVLLGANFGALAGYQLQSVVAEPAVALARSEAAGPPTWPGAAPTGPANPAPSTRPRPRKVKTPDAQPSPPPPAAPAPTPAQQPAQTPAPQQPAVPLDPSLVPFVGLSTWIDIYDTELGPIEQVDVAAAGGVQTIFVQSGKFDSRPIQFPRRLATVIERAHDYGMRVMVWYVPDFRNAERDFSRSVEAIAFTTARGDRADAFGLDIEVEHVRNIGRRTRRLLELSEALRGWAGPDYPMSAIVLPPLQLKLRPSWWPGFPYAELAAMYDVFIPMSYSSFRGTDAGTTYNWNVENVRQLRALVGDETFPIHLAGGIADNLPRIGAFIRAAGDANVLGAGLYDLHTTRADAWPRLRRLRSDPPAQ